MNSNRKVICAGCENHFFINETSFYRKKRWCSNENCKQVIDIKVKNNNYKKQKRKLDNGTFRHGVSREVREYIKNRDMNRCTICSYSQNMYKLQVHHIIPVKEGGSDDYNNLVLLCYECHKEVHQNDWRDYVSKLRNFVNA